MILSGSWALQIVADSGSDLQFVATAVDDSGSSITWRDVAHGTSNGTTPVDVVESPGTGNRVVRWVEITNNGVVDRELTVRLHNGSTSRVVRTWMIQPGALVTYGLNAGWQVLDPNGATRSSLAGSDAQVLYNTNGIVGAASHCEVNNGLLSLVSNSSPVAPPSGRVSLFGRELAGRVLPAAIGPSGRNTSLQPYLGRNRVAMWNPIGNATTAPLADGMAAPTTVGTATARSVATTNLLKSMRRLGYVSAGTAGSNASARVSAAQLCRGDGTVGGFTVIFRFGVSDAATVAGAQMFVGLWATTTADGGTQAPDAMVNVIGVGKLTGSNNMHLVHNDASGSATTVDLGTNFPAHTLSLDVYELVLFCNTGDSGIGWRLERLNTGNVDSGTVTSDIPASSTLLTIRLFRNNNATALAVGIDLCSVYVETDY